MERTMTVTDHAVLRSLQRQKGIEVEAYRKDLEQRFAHPRIKRLIDFAADSRCKITLGDGFTYCFKGGVMTTCYPKRSR